jgi:hypothetical protein
LPQVAGFSTQFSALKHEHDGYTEQSGASTYPAPASPPQPHEDYMTLDQEGFRSAIRWQNEGGFTADYASTTLTLTMARAS